MNYHHDMTTAPKDEILIGLVPTGNPENPVSYELMEWDDGLGRWEGEWRHLESESGEFDMAAAEPVAYTQVLEADPEIIEQERAKLAAQVG